MFFLYIQYYMHFYEIWCFLKSGYIWNRQQCGDISSIYVKRYLFGRCPVWKLVVRSLDLPDSGIWMVCYQVWWSEIGCCRLVIGTVLQVKRSGGLAADGGGWIHWDGWVLSKLNWCGCYKIIIIILCWCMVWWGVGAVSGSSGRDETHAFSWSLMTWRAMSRRVDPMSGCYRIANDKSPASLRGSVKKICLWLKKVWLCDSHGVRTHDPYIKSVMLYLLS